ncbi:MAG: low temperature requirement protein A, partial [Parascardovia denticolens]
YNQTQCPLPAGKGWLMATSVVVCFGLNLISRNALAIAAFAAFCAGINGVILGTCKPIKSDVS